MKTDTETNSPSDQNPHNPDGLTPEQAGVADGWRLLDEDEVGFKNSLWRQGVIQATRPSALGYWHSGPWECAALEWTYRTKLTRAELRAARGLPMARNCAETALESREAPKPSHDSGNGVAGSETPTPRTREMHRSVDGYGVNIPASFLRFTKQLERELIAVTAERDEAIKEANQARTTRRAYMELAEKKHKADDAERDVLAAKLQASESACAQMREALEFWDHCSNDELGEALQRSTEALATDAGSGLLAELSALRDRSEKAEQRWQSATNRAEKAEQELAALKAELRDRLKDCSDAIRSAGTYLMQLRAAEASLTAWQKVGEFVKNNPVPFHDCGCTNGSFIYGCKHVNRRLNELVIAAAENQAWCSVKTEPGRPAVNDPPVSLHAVGPVAPPDCGG